MKAVAHKSNFIHILNVSVNHCGMGTAASGLTAPAKMVASADPVLISAKTVLMTSESAHAQPAILEDTAKRRRNKINQIERQDLRPLQDLRPHQGQQLNRPLSQLHNLQQNRLQLLLNQPLLSLRLQLWSQFLASGLSGQSATYNKSSTDNVFVLTGLRFDTLNAVTVMSRLASDMIHFPTMHENRNRQPEPVQSALSGVNGASGQRSGEITLFIFK